MADPTDAYLAQPIRPGTEPTLSVSAAGLVAAGQQQPVYLQMTRVLLSVLRLHFSAAANIEFADLTDRIWTNAQSSPIMIASLAEWTPEQSAKRPALLVDRLDQTPDLARRILGQQFQGGTPGNYFQYMEGRHVVHCLGGREGEAELLAAEVFRELFRFGPVIQKYVCLNRFQVERAGKRRQLSDEHREHYTVPVPVYYHYGESWRVKPVDEAEINAVFVSGL